MKKYMYIGCSLFICLSLVYMIKANENPLLEDVYYIQYHAYNNENGIVDGKMDTFEVKSLINFVNQVNLKEMNKDNIINGWHISFACFNKKKEYMYNVRIIGNLFFIDKKIYHIDKENLNKLDYFIKNYHQSYNFS